MVVLAMAASVGAAGCTKSFNCARHGDTSAQATWQARGFVTSGANAQLCEASAARFEAVYANAPLWTDAWTALADGLKQRGFADSQRKGDALELDPFHASSVLEKCAAVDRQGKLVDCTEELRLHVTPAGKEFSEPPYTVRAEHSATPFHYSFGDRQDGPVPAFARAHAH
jgi:hypothetical protein